MRRSLFSALLALTFASIVSLPVHAQDWAAKRLEASPRHHEYVPLKHDGRTVNAFVVYPEVKGKAPVIVMIHEIFGLSDWAKEMADELAASGYIVVAPDLLTGSGPNGGDSTSFPSMDMVTKAVMGLDAAQVTADLNAAADYGKSIPASNGVTFVAGFCWGGGKTFDFATHRHDLAASFVFYGPGPADVSAINAPVYGFYAGNDARIGATLPATTEAMKTAGKKFDPVTYEGAGHGFMRAGEDPTPADSTKPGAAEMKAANMKARTEAYARMTRIMKELGSKRFTPVARMHTPVTPAKAEPTMQCHDAMGTK